MAAACCAFLLQRSSLNYSVVRVNRIGPSTIIASTATQTLYCDIFEDPGLFSSFPAIRKRIVRWGSHPEVVALPHSGVVVSETALLEKLWPKINQDTSAINSEANGVDADWVLHSWREPKRSEEHHFG